jgi:hypothetical protein
MSSQFGWNHPIDESDQWDGFNDSGIEHFAGNPIPHLAREVNQNSFDSRVSGQVVVRFNRSSVETDSIPNLEELKNTVQLCQAAAENESEKARLFFKRAQDLLAERSISVLTISDHNTKGMSGPCRNGTPFFAFMKAHGQSKKSSATELGSFGIGKFAPYAVSNLRTVFVSTVYEDSKEGLVRLTQGKSIFMSHDDEIGHRRRGMGFWGVKEKCQPVENRDSFLPAWIARGGQPFTSTDIGTSLSIVGFDPSTGWQERIAASVAENFFGSIANGLLRVEIDKDRYVLAKETIGEFFENEKVLAVISNEEREPDLFFNSRNYWRCLTSAADSIVEESQTTHLGLCRLRIVIGEGLPKKVCFLRSGMFISDQLPLAGLKSFSDFKEFVAVFECIDPAGIELLRAMEPPRHDDFQYARLATKEDQKKGKSALAEVAKWIREMLKKHAKDPVTEVTQLDELKDFFADDSDHSSASTGQEEANPQGKIVIRAKPIPPRTPRPSPVPTAGPDLGQNPETGEGGGGGEGEGGGGTESGGVGTAAAGLGSGASRPGVSLVGLRAVPTSSKSRRISFTPDHGGVIAITVFEAGADSDYPLAVRECSVGEIKAGRVLLDVERGERISVDIAFRSAFDGALKVVAHEV